MAFLQPPYTLGLNDGMQTITKLLYDVRLIETLTPSDPYLRMIEATSYGSVPNGSGVINTIKTKYMEVEKRTKDGSGVFDLREPTLMQEAAFITDYEFVAISQESEWLRQSTTSSSLITGILSFTNRLAPDTLKVDMYENKIEPFFVDTKWARTANLAGVWDTSDPTTFLEKEAQMKYNAKQLAKWIKGKVNTWYRTRTDVTDIDGVVTQLSPSDITMYVDSNMMIYIAIALTDVFHPDSIRQTFGVGNIVEVPSRDEALNPDAPLIWIGHPKKVSHLTGYTWSGSIVNPQNIYTNTFYHRATGQGIWATLPGLQVSINEIPDKQFMQVNKAIPLSKAKNLTIAPSGAKVGLSQ